MKGKRVNKILLFKAGIMVCILIALVIPMNFIVFLHSYHEQQKSSSQQMFSQIKQLIEVNESDVAEERDEYSELCIQKAETVAYFLAHEPDTINKLESMQELARVIDIDEIHIFNTQGKIYAGTHPEYYGYSVYSGEQMAFFEQMLNDKTLSLCQEILPNTAEGKEMQYSAVWLDDESGFVQIGMRPERLLELVEEKSLKNVVKNIPFEEQEFFHVLDLEQGEIIASSIERMVGQDFSDNMVLRQSKESVGVVQMHREYNGKRYCIYTQDFGEYLLIHTYRSEYILSRICGTLFALFLAVLLTIFVIVGVFLRHIQRSVVDNIAALNKKITEVEEGNLENLVIDTEILEFNSLVHYINQLLHSIRFDNVLIKDIFNSGQISVGVFAYDSFYKKMFMSYRMKDIIGLDIDESQSFDIQQNIVMDKISEIKQNCVDQKQEIYQYYKNGEALYVKLKEYSEPERAIYYLQDITMWWEEMRTIKADSIHDALTGLFNRKGIQENAKCIFENQQMSGKAAVILLDADGLKRINDMYGHTAGDEYLREIGSILSALPKEHAISARLGGDEFVVIVYGFDRKEEVDAVIKELISKRSSAFDVPQLLEQKEKLEFSVGYSYFPSEGKNYQELMNLADARMYQEKRRRKLQMEVKT